MAEAIRKTSEAQSIAERIEALDWKSAGESLSQRGHAVTPAILSPAECVSLAALYGDASRFRSQIIMERYRFGIGDYKYFGHPLPEIVTSLRTHAYPYLADVANQWAEALGEKNPRFPSEHAAFLKICHKAGQTKPTPLFLHYEAGGYNCLHQDMTATSVFRCRWFSCWGSRGTTGKAGSSCWSSSSRGRNPKARWCGPIKARRLFSRRGIGPCAARAVTTV